MRVLAFRHVPFEGLGLIEPALEARGIHFDYCDLYRPGAVLPDAQRYDGLIFMGGPMSVNDEPAFLLEEMRVIERAAARCVPMLGVCLGSQMIAKALGGRVYRNSQKEIGWFDIHLTDEGRRDPLLAQLAPAERVFHWHGDTFDLPPEAVWLAYSQRTARQAYRIGPAIYGLQFHLEVTPAMIVNWSGEDENCGDVRELSAPLDPWLNYDRCREIALSVFGKWCEMLAPARMEPRGDTVPEDPKPDVPESAEIPVQVRPFPRCPNCGWKDVRFAYTRNALDALLGRISVQRFKCRSCGSYFRRWYGSTA